MPETLTAHGGLELDLGRRIGSVVIVDEAHRTTADHCVEAPSGSGFGIPLQLADEQPDDLAEGHGALLHPGGVVEQRSAQHALQRPHQPAIGAGHVFGHGATPEECGVLLERKEDRRGQCRPSLLERQQCGHAIVGHRHRRIGGAEIHAAMRKRHLESPALKRKGRPRAALSSCWRTSLENWWSQSESNRRPLECHSSALPTELWPHHETAGAASIR